MAVCGTSAGLQAHRARDELVCRACLDWWNAYRWGLRHGRPASEWRPRGGAPCGTPAAYRAHRRRREDACAACKAAHAAYGRARKAW